MTMKKPKWVVEKERQRKATEAETVWLDEAYELPLLEVSETVPLADQQAAAQEIAALSPCESWHMLQGPIRWN